MMSNIRILVNEHYFEKIDETIKEITKSGYTYKEVEERAFEMLTKGINEAKITEYLKIIFRA